jgi:hypothetical protein
VAAGNQGREMKALNNRLFKLESRLRLIETAASRRDLELGRFCFGGWLPFVRARGCRH